MASSLSASWLSQSSFSCSTVPFSHSTYQFLIYYKNTCLSYLFLFVSSPCYNVKCIRPGAIVLFTDYPNRLGQGLPRTTDFTEWTSGWMMRWCNAMWVWQDHSKGYGVKTKRDAVKPDKQPAWLAPLNKAGGVLEKWTQNSGKARECLLRDTAEKQKPTRKQTSLQVTGTGLKLLRDQPYTPAVDTAHHYEYGKSQGQFRWPDVYLSHQVRLPCKWRCLLVSQITLFLAKTLIHIWDFLPPLFTLYNEYRV